MKNPIGSERRLIVQRKRIAEILRLALLNLSEKDSAFPKPPDSLDEELLLEDLGIRHANSRMLMEELKLHMGTVPDINMALLLEKLNDNKNLPWDSYTLVKHLLNQFEANIQHRIRNPMAVYVDDEEENLFVFKRKYTRRMALLTYQDSREALDFILKTKEVVLVITDEVMPNLTGNQLRDLVHRQKPFLKFILITGNPQHDEDLMYRSLKRNRFFDCIQKPIDLENKGEEYFALFNEVLSGDYY